MKQQNKPSSAAQSAVLFMMPPLPKDLRTPEQQIKDKLEMAEIDKKMRTAFKDGVDLSGQETPMLPKTSLLPAVHTYYANYGNLLPLSGLKFVVDNDLFDRVNSDFQKAIDSDKPLGDLSNYVESLAKDFHRQRQERFSAMAKGG
jgi:hypothetical protein